MLQFPLFFSHLHLLVSRVLLVIAPFLGAPVNLDVPICGRERLRLTGIPLAYSASRRLNQICLGENEDERAGRNLIHVRNRLILEHFNGAKRVLGAATRDCGVELPPVVGSYSWFLMR
jgi:hypothetical protein